jgi:hypothetical protein
VLTPAALARLGRAGLHPDGEPGSDGTPREPVLLLDLDAATSAEDVQDAARAARSSLALIVGVAADRSDLTVLDPLVEALDLVLAPAGDRRTVRGDPDDVLSAASRAPRAALTLGRLLRQCADLDVRDALAAESAAYSTLLAGPERAALLPRRTLHPDEGPRVRIESRGDELRIILCRPDRLNRVDARLRDELCDALSLAVADPDRQVTLAADGADWSTGGDLEEFGSLPDPATAHVVRQARSVGWLIHLLGDRIRVDLHGRCIGSGIEMPAFAGRVTARRDLRASLPELGLGLVPGAGGTVSLTRRIGRWRTCWLVLSGQPLDAGTALAWGLVDEVVP